MFRTLFGQRCYDVDRKCVFRMRLGKIPQSWITAEVEGIDGIVWLDPSKLDQGDFKHSGLPEDCLSYIEEIMILYNGIYDLSKKEWIDGFKRDANPAKEIAIWLFFGKRLRSIIESESLTDNDSKELFRLMISVMNGGSDRDEKHGRYGGIVGIRVQEFIKRLKMPDA